MGRDLFEFVRRVILKGGGVEEIDEVLESWIDRVESTGNLRLFPYDPSNFDSVDEEEVLLEA